MMIRRLLGGYRSSIGKASLEKISSSAGANNGPQRMDMNLSKTPPATEGVPHALETEPVRTEAATVDRLPFNFWVAATTFMNIVIMGLEQDLGPKNVDFAKRLPFFVLECWFTVSFVIEICIRIRCAGRKFPDWVSDLWNAADVTLVLGALVDTFVLSLIGVGGTIRFFTVLRALRVVRLVKLVRMYPAFRELWLLVGGLISSVKALAWVGVIVLCILYAAAIVVTVTIGQNHITYNVGPSYDGEIWPYDKYFGDVPSSMFSLFQVMTLDAWCDDIVRHIVYRQPFMGLFFVVFLLLTSFGLMNVVVGIIVENTLAAAQVADRRTEEHSAAARKEAIEHLTDILVKSDSRRTGEISVPELQVAYESIVVQDLFAKIGLTMEEALNIFNLLDHERRGRVELKRFADSCRELIGGAKRRDIAQVEITMGTLARHLEHLDGQFAQIEGEVAGLTEMAKDFMQNTVRTLTGFDGVQKPPAVYIPDASSYRKQ